MIKFFKFLTVLLVSFSVVAIGVSLFFFFYYNKEPRNVFLEINTPEKISRGAPFKVDVSVFNRSDAFLSGATITLIVPRDMIILESKEEGQMASQSVGDIKSGGLEKKSFTVVSTLNSSEVSKQEDSNQESASLQNSIEKITAKLSYSLGGRNSDFEINSVQEVQVKESSLSVDSNHDSQIVGGSVFSIELKYKNNSDFDFSNISLSADYPRGFTFSSASVPPTSLNNYWKLSSLKAGSSGALLIKGVLEGSDSASFEMPITIFGTFADKDYPIVKNTIKLNIAPSPIGLEIFVNGSEDYAARLGEKLNYVIRYRNLSGVSLSNVTLKADMRGELFDFSTLDTSALLDSSKSALRWNSSNIPGLALLQPGETGSVDFSIMVRNSFSMSHFGDKNYSLALNVSADSPSVPYYFSGERIKAFKEMAVKIKGITRVEASVMYKDSSSNIVNSGSIPPSSGNPTQYTIHWILKNYATDVRDVKVRTFLRPGVKWTGIVKAQGLPIKYNDFSREVVWEVSSLNAARGVLSDPIEAVFQVEATPDASFVGKAQPIIDKTSLTAIDNFTGATIQSSYPALTTASLSDINETKQGIVTP